MSNETDGEAGDRLVQRLRFDFPDLPEQILIDMLVEGAREMGNCGLMQVNIDITQDVQPGVADYDFADYLPDGYDVNAIEAVEWCGECIDPIDPKCDPCPYGYEICGPCSIRLHPCPSRAPGQTLELCISIKPNANACLIPEVLADKYAGIMLNLARGEILCLPNQSFTNLRASVRYRDKGRTEMRTEMDKLMPKGTKSTQVSQAKGSQWF